MKEDKTKNITKYNIFMWPIRNLIKILATASIVEMLIILIIIIVRYSKIDVVLMLQLAMVMPIFSVVLIFTLGSFRSYRALYLLHKQEKYLHVNMEKELVGKKMKGSSYEAMYEDENWFVCYGGSYVNIYHKKYIQEIQELQKTAYYRKTAVYAVDGSESTFLLSNMYGKNFPKFKAWCNR